MLLSCHINTNICALIFEAGNNTVKCANQSLSAKARYVLLGLRTWSASVTPCTNRVRHFKKGRADKTALSDRRRQLCRTPSKPFWPSASSQFSLHVHSKKSRWSSSKSQLWRSSNLELPWSGHQPRPNLGIGSKCTNPLKSSCFFLFSALLDALEMKKWCWLSRNLRPTRPAFVPLQKGVPC